MKRSLFKPFSFTTRGRLVTFDRPAVMGILNITSDSFYDGGLYTTAQAMLDRVHRILDEGADIIDLGATSTRPGTPQPDPNDEAARLREAVTLLRAELPEALISVDTCFPESARAVVEAGADIINDIGGGDVARPDPGKISPMFAVAAELQVPYVLMHGAAAHFGLEPMDEQADMVDSVVRFLSQRLDQLYRLGLKDVWLDPGFGFGKTMAQNHDLLQRLDELTGLFREPVLVGLSRKRMVYMPLGSGPDDALAGTIALDAIALDRGAAIIRVHDVKPAVDTVKLLC
ncbi:MAG: dihydropteroate synthase [Bacteroidales bacterium]|nr:dihydropteroate synthase [Bacteroidales bacterium]